MQLILPMYRRALELDPESEDILSEYCVFYLLPMRRLHEAIAIWQKAVHADPLSPLRRRMLGYIYYLMRQYGNAIDQCNNALELDPAYLPVIIHLSQAYNALGKFDEAIRILETSRQYAEETPGVLEWLGFSYAQANRIGEAKQLLEVLKGIAQTKYMPSYCFGLISLGLGEIDTCFDWIEKAIEERESVSFYINTSPLFDPLRSHPRYHALLRKMNLEA